MEVRALTFADVDLAAEPCAVLRVERSWDQKPIRLHECRHSFVSLWHDAGVSLDRIGDYAGQASSGTRTATGTFATAGGPRTWRS